MHTLTGIPCVPMVVQVRQAGLNSVSRCRTHDLEARLSKTSFTQSLWEGGQACSKHGHFIVVGTEEVRKEKSLAINTEVL